MKTTVVTHAAQTIQRQHQFDDWHCAHGVCACRSIKTTREGEEMINRTISSAKRMSKGESRCHSQFLTFNAPTLREDLLGRSRRFSINTAEGQDSLLFLLPLADFSAVSSWPRRAFAPLALHSSHANNHHIIFRGLGAGSTH